MIKEDFGNNHEERKKTLKKEYTDLKKKYKEWLNNQPDQKEYYSQIIKKIDCVLLSIERNKKIKQIIGMTLVTALGAYVSNQVVKKLDLDIFGWFSDRDSINEVCDNFSIQLFHTYLHNFSDGKQFKFLASPAGSTANAFYEQLVRIPDYISGTISDYDRKLNQISNDKFDAMLTNYMAGNTHNNFVLKLSTDVNGLYCSRILIDLKE
ncbi:hypothetical protein [Marivirga arenosa]|uniref:hypothetical protein n=1 Tax=Marivirga arenosa TaxID=3059076 RepID=UPI00265DA0CF|nr:hypothetical protein [Marivirga sp. BKB1-2]WKK83410.1 hypothetical protein QYS47_28015 [Marivirga sp. BKB1-2]